MNDEEIAVKLTALEHETKSAKHRLDDLEILGQTIQDLALSIKELTINMQAMIKEQGEQGKRLAKLENEPAERWNSAKRTAFNTIVGAIAGAFATGAVYMVAQFIK